MKRMFLGAVAALALTTAAGAQQSPLPYGNPVTLAQAKLVIQPRRAPHLVVQLAGARQADVAPVTAYLAYLNGGFGSKEYLLTAGAFVALDPRNGQVLALGSAPSFDPSVLATPISKRRYDAIFGEAAGSSADRVTSWRATWGGCVLSGVG